MEMRVSSLAGLAALAVGQANSSQAQKGRESILICGGAQPASEPVLRRGLTSKVSGDSRVACLAISSHCDGRGVLIVLASQLRHHTGIELNTMPSPVWSLVIQYFCI